MHYELVTLERTDLAQRIANKLGKNLREATLRQFADGELSVQLHDYHEYAGKIAVIIQSTGGKVNEYTLGLSFLAQTLKQAGAQKIIAVVPYLGYCRHDRGIDGKPGHLEVIGNLFKVAGVDEMITVELHDTTVTQFLTLPVTNISLQDRLASLISEAFPKLETVCLVAPDKGAHKHVRALANKLGTRTIVCSKERFATDQTRILDCVVDCDGKQAVLVDDIISTGGTIAHVAKLLADREYHDMVCYVVHPVLAGDALNRLQAAGVSQLIVSNSLPRSSSAKTVPFLSVFDISEDIVSVLKEKLDEME